MLLLMLVVLLLCWMDMDGRGLLGECPEAEGFQGGLPSGLRVGAGGIQYLRPSDQTP